MRVATSTAAAGRRVFAALCVALVASSVVALAPVGTEAAASTRLVSVIVRKLPGAGGSAESRVRDLGGRVTRELPIINGFAARLPESAVARVRAGSGVASVTSDERIRPLSVTSPVAPADDMGALYNVSQIVGAKEAWRQGYTGAGIDVAVIDTGVAPVQGLHQPGKVFNGPDLSFDSQADNLRYLDGYGHGTHMAGIIAGNDTASSSPEELTDPSKFVGVAPDARIVNVKVGASDGATDVSQVIAAFDWIVQHRHDNGLDIRVVNLSFGTDGSQSYIDDPLAYAAEVAWRKGIVVVVAGGNDGTNREILSNPALDPYLLAVGADDPMGTLDLADDTVPPFATRGTLRRHVDLIAPGKSVVSLRVPGSYIDTNFPSGAVGERFFRGSGTSQAAAVTSGAAALLLQAQPSLTPDRVKKLLTAGARPLVGVSQIHRGAGIVQVDKVLQRPIGSATQPFTPSTGTGSLELARGTSHVYDGDVALTGEQDIFGSAWDGRSWSADAWAGRSWSGGFWNGNEWTGDVWDGYSWLGRSWSGRSWSGRSWSGRSWSGRSWSGRSWSGEDWTDGWSGRSWSGRSWSSAGYW